LFCDSDRLCQYLSTSPHAYSNFSIINKFDLIVQISHFSSTPYSFNYQHFSHSDFSSLISRSQSLNLFINSVNYRCFTFFNFSKVFNYSSNSFNYTL